MFISLTLDRPNPNHNNTIFLGGKEQHGFIKNKSTATAGLLLQFLIARALDSDEYVALASIDLSAAFDIVDVNLLISLLLEYWNQFNWNSDYGLNRL